MPPRDPPLPEGTDQIIDTNNDTGGSSAVTGKGGGRAAPGVGGGATEIAKGVTIMTDTTSGAGSTGDNSAFFNEGRGATGGTAGTSGSDTGSKSGVSKAADTIVSQLKDQVSTLRGTAGDKARSYAADGKRQTTDFLTTVAQIIQDAAGSVEERLGGQYAGFGNRAADQVSSLARTLDEREIDDLIEDARAFVRRSPTLAIGIAAVVGFAAARVIRSGVEDLSQGTGTEDNSANSSGQTGQTGTTGMASGGTTGSTGGMGAGASGGLGATGGAFGEQGVGTAGTAGGTGSGSNNGAGSSAPKY